MKNNKTIFVFLVWLLFMIACKEQDTRKTGSIVEVNTGKGRLIENRIGQSDFYISIPDDYILKENAGPDFSVYYFYPSDTAVKAPFSGGLYFGNFPQKFEPKNDSCKIRDIKSRILDSLTNWTVHNCQGNYFVQTFAESKDPEGRGGTIHAFGNAKTQAGLNRILEIFGTMR